MTNEQFRSQIERLKKVYGANAYPEERMKLLAKNFIDLDESAFESIIDSAISNSNKTPLLEDLKQYGRKQLSDFYSAKGIELDKSINLQRCCYCEGSGFITAVEKSSLCVYAFRCDKCKCADMRRIGKDIQTYRPSDKFELGSTPSKTALGEYAKKKGIDYISEVVTKNIVDDIGF